VSREPRELACKLVKPTLQERDEFLKNSPTCGNKPKIFSGQLGVSLVAAGRLEVFSCGVGPLCAE
jgi:hypothetical protein